MTTALLQSIKDAASSLTSLLFVDGSTVRTRVGEILRTDAETANLLLWLVAAGATGFLVFLSIGLSAGYILYIISFWFFLPRAFSILLTLVSLWVLLSVAFWLLLSVSIFHHPASHLYQVRV